MKKDEHLPPASRRPRKRWADVPRMTGPSQCSGHRLASKNEPIYVCMGATERPGGLRGGLRDQVQRLAMLQALPPSGIVGGQIDRRTLTRQTRSFASLAERGFHFRLSRRFCPRSGSPRYWTRRPQSRRAARSSMTIERWSGVWPGVGMATTARPP